MKLSQTMHEKFENCYTITFVNELLVNGILYFKLLTLIIVLYQTYNYHILLYAVCKDTGWNVYIKRDYGHKR